MFRFLSVPMGAAYHVVIGLATVLTPIGAGLATAVAIVMFTAGVRLLLSPLSFFAFRGQASLARLQPKIADLRKKYGNQPERLQAELTALYRAEGGGMLAGCLPLLLQLPFFSVMYRLFLSPVVAGQRNGLLTRSLLGTPLGSHLLSGAGLVTAHVLVFGGLLALLAAAAYLTAKAARRTEAVVAGSAAVAAVGAAAVSAAAQPAGMGALGRILPYSTVVIAAFVPLAAGLYLLTTTCWTLAERAVMARLQARGQREAGSVAVAAPVTARRAKH
jgi:YidC/Oxa1 family membrane protein insertase